MSKTAEATGDATGEAPKGKKPIVMIIVVILLVAGSAGGTWFYMQSLMDQMEGGEAAEVPEPIPAPILLPTVFHELEIFTVNLMPEEYNQFLQVGLTVKTTELPEVEEEITKQMPAIRNRILILLSSKTAAEISSATGKQQLSAEIADEIRETFDSRERQAHVLEVLFTSFVIQ
ncbi:MAG: flagellar basal body-associated protein FliL [Betaproteobacteria bacterium]|nr:flagellar basal body-associated protein FliL [Betaproteobacteria bacterium]